MKHKWLIILVGCIATVSNSAKADSLTLIGLSIPLKGITIRTIQNGRIYLFDASDRQGSRSLDEIDSISFDDLKEMDLAEEEFAKGNYQSAVEGFLVAALKAKTAVHRLWIYQRLAQSHNYQGQYVQAAGHAATVFMLQDDLYWRRLVPRGGINEPSYAAAAESMQKLRDAARKVKQPQLKRSINEMTAAVRPIFDKLKANYKGEPYKSGSTISGIEKSQIGKARIEAAKASQQHIEKLKPPKPPIEVTGSKKPNSQRRARPSSSESIGPTSARAIDDLLAENRAIDAVELCKRIAKNPGERELDRFLHQYGLALLRTDKKPKAAIMLLQCAISFPGSQYAASSLIETALIYETAYNKPDTTIRLLERAVAIATAQRQAEAATRARRELARLKL